MTPSKRIRWVKQVVAVFLLLGAAGLGGLYVLHGRHASAGDSQDEEIASPPEVQVKSVHPRRDPRFALTVSRPANVEAYYRAPIEARVAGEVEWIKVARGSQVKLGDVLVRIRVPDLDADAEQKGELVHQREQELELAKSAVHTAEANVEEKATLRDAAIATRELRELEFVRKDTLWRRDALDKEARDEADQMRKVARASEAAAVAAKKRAEAELADAKARVRVAEADVEVAKAARKSAVALAGYARVKAPWDGTVITRQVDPGSFVQNASTGHPTPLVTLERTDVVTVTMRVPDNVAPFVKLGTEATLELDELPGVKIQGRVTRIAPSLETADRDRTMRVDVDLWNSDPVQYPAFLAANYNGDVPKPGADVKDGLPPLMPTFTGEDALNRSRHLMADMYGKMTLSLRTFADSLLIPSVAVLHGGGREFLYLVEGGKAHKVPIRVLVEDGNLAKVVRVDKNGRVLGELTGKEEVIVSNLEELNDGLPVEAALQEDWNALEGKR